LWLGPVPVPGLPVALAFLTVSLFARMIQNTRWRSDKVGIHLTHLGVLLLLAGGFVTAITSTEGFLVLEEGKPGGRIVTDYHARELTIWKNKQPLQIMPLEEIRDGIEINPPVLPFRLQIVTHCRNCKVVMATEEDEIGHGPAAKMRLQPDSLRKEDEENLSGVMFRVSALDKARNGLYLAFEPVGKLPTFEIGKDTYHVSMHKQTRLLPFSLQLTDFRKTPYPGMDLAKAYESDVLLKDGEITRKATISMNKPLRYEGYTFYQSSYITDGKTTKSVLAVVRNTGSLFPYLACALIALGLAMHVALRLPKLIKPKMVRVS
jgi:hypothetical protein